MSLNLITITPVEGNPENIQSCGWEGCSEWRFHQAASTDKTCECVRCGHMRLLKDSEKAGVFPRPHMHYWDQLNLAPTYSFLLGAGGNSVKRVNSTTGRYVEKSDIEPLIEAAQNEIAHLKSRLQSLTTLKVVDSES